MKELLFVVDMVNGFVKEGSMHDQKIMNIVDSIKEECESHEHRIFIRLCSFLQGFNQPLGDKKCENQLCGIGQQVG